jgi:hypothetical protein
VSGQAKAWAETVWRRRDLSAGAKVVLVLADRHQFPTKDNPELGCFPSQEDIAERAGMARSTVNRHLDELVAAKVFSRTRRSTENGRTSTAYFLAMSDCSDIGEGAMSDAMSDCSDTNPSSNLSLKKKIQSPAVVDPVVGRERAHTTTAAPENLSEEERLHRAVLALLGLSGGRWTSPRERKITARWCARLKATGHPSGYWQIIAKYLPRLAAQRTADGATINSLRYFDGWVADMVPSESDMSEAERASLDAVMNRIAQAGG